MTLILDRPDAQVHHATWRELLDVLPRREDGTVCDALIVDAPYSERTHSGHGARRDATRMPDPGKLSRSINYAHWSDDDVRTFVQAWSPVVAGWLVSITDHVLARSWERHLDDSGRYTFSPLACVERGSRIRLAGDGPAQWSTWAVVARRRDGEWLRAWQDGRRERGETTGLPGAYVGGSEGKAVVGGKPEWLMSALVRDYSRPGDLVIDPCCGAGTTGVAAVRLGRRFIGGDQMLEHALLAARRLAPVREQRRLFDGPDWRDVTQEGV